MRKEVLALYRSLSRNATRLSHHMEPQVGRGLQLNVRAVFEVHRDVQDPERIRESVSPPLKPPPVSIYLRQADLNPPYHDIPSSPPLPPRLLAMGREDLQVLEKLNSHPPEQLQLLGRKPSSLAAEQGTMSRGGPDDPNTTPAPPGGSGDAE